MDFSTGIPIEFRTLVAVPTMLESKDQIQKILDDLEVRFLSNRDSNLFFSLLTDYKDAKEETTHEDTELLQLVTQGIEGLNKNMEGQRTTPSSCFIGPENGTRRKNYGWVTSGSEGNWAN
jgi:hypothetical protein